MLAARITDTTSDGVVTGPGVPNVHIGGLPAAVAGDISTPATSKPPAPFTRGSATVLIGGRPALRQGDVSANGSVISMGCCTVTIG